MSTTVALEALQFSDLVEELLVHIFRFLSYDALYELAFVSRSLRRIATDRILRLKEGLKFEAQVFIEQQNYAKALESLFKVTRLFDASGTIWKEIGLCYKQLENFELACEALIKGRKISSGPYELFLKSQLALYVRHKAGIRARVAINEAIQADPDDLRFYHFRAFIEAGMHIEDELPPGAPAPSVADARNYHQQSLRREMADYMFILNHEKPYKRIASIYNNIGAVHFEFGDNPRALEFFQKALDICPYYVQALYNRAILWKDIGHHELAVEDYTNILHINPDLHKISGLRAVSFYALGVYADAREDFLEAIKGPHIELDSLRGALISLIRFGELDRVEELFEPINARVRAKWIENERKHEQEIIPKREFLEEHGEQESLADDSPVLIRLEAAERAYKKVHDELEYFRPLLLRYLAEVGLMRGRFTVVLDQDTRVLVTESIYFIAMRDLLDKYGLVSISNEAREFTWQMCQNCRSRHLLDILDSLRHVHGISLVTPAEQLYFLYSFAYFYFALHSVRHLPRQEVEWSVVRDLEEWIRVTTSAANQDGTLRSSSLVALRFCQSPFLLLSLFEIFARGSDLREGSHRQTLAQILHLRLSMDSVMLQDDEAFFATARRHVTELVNAHLAPPHFRGRNF